MVSKERRKKRADSKRNNAHHEHQPSDTMDILIDAINTMDLGWKADVCKLQKHHNKYGKHCHKDQVNLAQTFSNENEEDNAVQEEKLKFGHGPEF